MKLFQILLVLIIMTQNAFAEKVNLARITNDMDKESFYSMQLNLSNVSNKIDELIVTMLTKKERKVLERFTFKVNNLKTGIILLEVKETPVVKLIAPNFDFFEGGKLKLTYLSNGISKSYVDIYLELKKDTAGRWNLTVLNDENYLSDRNITELFFKSRKLWPIGVIGIKNVSFKFGEE